MSNTEEIIQSINIDFATKRITLKVVESKKIVTDGDPSKDYHRSFSKGKAIENLEKLLNIDERFKAINQRLSLNTDYQQPLETLKLSVILKAISLADFDAGKQEISFIFGESFELLDVEKTE